MIAWSSEDEEGELIDLCPFSPDTLLNQSWQASSLRGEFDGGGSREYLQMHN